MLSMSSRAHNPETWPHVAAVADLGAVSDAQPSRGRGSREKIKGTDPPDGRGSKLKPQMSERVLPNRDREGVGAMPIFFHGSLVSAYRAGERRNTRDRWVPRGRS